MIRLDSASRTLQLVTDLAVTTNELSAVVAYSDKTTGYDGGVQVSLSTGTTPVDICSSPSFTPAVTTIVRDIDTITIVNLDTVSAKVYINYNDDGTTYNIITVTLAVGDHLEYTHADGWKVVDTAGNIKTTSGTTSPITPSALSKVDDTNVTLTLGGTPLTALLQGVLLTLGWTGVLAYGRGGTGLNALGTALQQLRVNAGATALEYFTASGGSGIATAVATGTVDAITATFSPVITLADLTVVLIRSSGPNTITNPTFNPDALGAQTITKNGGDPLAVGDIDGDVMMMYDLANTRWELITAKAGGGSGVQVAVATGTVNAITATYSPVLTLTDLTVAFLRASGPNTITNPTFNPDALGALTITKNGGDALVAGDIDGDVILMYDLANTRWELITPKASWYPTTDLLQSTGIFTGGVLSIGVGGAGVATTFTIASGTGQVVDNTVNPTTVTPVTWAAKTNVAITNLLTKTVTYVAIDSSGNVQQSATDWTPAQLRTYIEIGVVVHADQTVVNAVNQMQGVAYNALNQFQDLTYSLQGFNVGGNIFSANGANLKLNKSAGSVFKQGANYSSLTNNPHVVSLIALVQAPLRMQNQTGAGSATTTNIDPDNYDVGGVTTAVPANKFSILRIYSFVSNLVAVQRGQAYYNSLAEAKGAIQTEAFVANTVLESNGILRGYLVVRKGATNLTTATDASFLQAAKFGGSSGVGGLSVSTLQNAYDNSADPEITTDATRGAVSIKRGSAADTDNILEGLNGAGSTKWGLTGAGKQTMYNTLDEAKGGDIASAGTTDIGASTGNYINVTGTTTITALGTIQAGTRRIINFSGILTLTYNATSLILPGASNITTSAGDVAIFISLGSGNWKCVSYQRNSSVSGSPSNSLFNYYNFQ